MTVFEWDRSDKTYPSVTIHADHVAGLSEWLQQLAHSAAEFGGDWNVMIADLWPNDDYSRLIGHVQMSNVAVGYDTGFRVCAYLKGGGIVGDSGDDRSLITKWLRDAVAERKTKSLLSDTAVKNPFDLRLTHYGEDPIRRLPIIPF